jgi:hypothetical protein
MNTIYHVVGVLETRLMSLAIFSQLRSSPARGKAGCGVWSCYSPRVEWLTPAEHFSNRTVQPNFIFDSCAANFSDFA